MGNKEFHLWKMDNDERCLSCIYSGKPNCPEGIEYTSVEEVCVLFVPTLECRKVRALEKLAGCVIHISNLGGCDVFGIGKPEPE